MTAAKHFPGGCDADTADELCGGLITELRDRGIAANEEADGSALSLFSGSRAPGLVVPRHAGGIGVDGSTAVAVQSALAGVAPSVAVATLMHHLSVVTLSDYIGCYHGHDAEQWELLRAVAERGMLMASAISEGRSGAEALAPATTARRSGDGWIINGSKKPCSLSRSMDLLTCTVSTYNEQGVSLGVSLAVLPAQIPGITTADLWTSPVLLAAESHEVRLDDVRASTGMVLPPGPGGNLDELGLSAWAWFNVLAAATYLGVAVELTSRAAASPRNNAAQLGALAAKIYACRNAVDAAAEHLVPGGDADAAFTHSVAARAVTETLAPDIAVGAFDLLGGHGLACDPVAPALLAASRALRFHPLSSDRSLPVLGEWISGNAPPTELFRSGNHEEDGGRA
ncbi:acyl-CoA/acyl-ACP dehydrogenase [Corynebacterium sp. P7202]|uniref:Acyl-CoA/acyl-ACP dehydrogenase n=1 Tax=Corynebacterium pygosceleis TaxID=2800406 RepID=A0A9Q4C7L1_9CORY|nr:acyl-CoA dehydrogenase family protein [Corynebacterium pygosceleis]MCK7637489.1 acyl-CoA/acyl-ACP dehydrogenase [Corynebacterium pygosceleis]MCX7444982.1 acyl-CoA/acyl-ACP dehydrogenase [Corynebacterium pygosceleis]MCX7468182.1 acyl-CoA/acyl-ACP dehydrogenase [Corynebacterium pygosceleis]